MNLRPTLLAVFALCLCCASLTSTAQKIIPVDTMHVQTLRIDPSNAMGGKVTDFFSEVEYLPLETTKESLFGSIKSLEMTKDRYYILESEGKYVLIFDKKGKFIKKIGSEATRINEFALNKWAKQFVIMTEYGRNFSYYDLDGNLIKKETVDLALVKDKLAQQIYYLSKDKGFAEGSYYTSDTTSKYYKTYMGSLIVYSDDSHAVLAKGLQFPKTQAGLDRMYTGRSAFVTPGEKDSIYYYSKLYDYAIYAIGPNSIKLSYKFIFPLTSSLPAGFINDTTLHSKRWEYFDKYREQIQNVANFYRTGNNITFTARSRELNDEDMLIFNLKSGSLIGYKHIGLDSATHFLPIFERRAAYTNGGIITAQDNSLYMGLSSLEMFKNFEENKDRKIKYPPHLEKYFTTRDRKDNPVILRLKLKDDL